MILVFVTFMTLKCALYIIINENTQYRNAGYQTFAVHSSN